MRLLYAFCVRFLGPIVAVWVRGIELRAQAIAAVSPDFDEYADEAIELSADHFDLWEKELSKR